MLSPCSCQIRLLSARPVRSQGGSKGGFACHSQPARASTLSNQSDTPFPFPLASSTVGHTYAGRRDDNFKFPQVLLLSIAKSSATLPCSESEAKGGQVRINSGVVDVAQAPETAICKPHSLSSPVARRPLVSHSAVFQPLRQMSHLYFGDQQSRPPCHRARVSPSPLQNPR